MKKHWYYDHPKFFHGLALAIGVITVAVPLWVMTQPSGCRVERKLDLDVYFQTLNEGDGGQDGE